MLLGSGDAAYLRTTTVIAALAGFLPVLLATHYFGWGLAGIWWGMGTFVVMRLIAVAIRVRGDRWMVLGAHTPGRTPGVAAGEDTGVGSQTGGQTG